MEIIELRKWLEKDGNTKSKLAYLLEYKSTNVIDRWLRTGEITRREKQRVKQIISGSK